MFATPVWLAALAALLIPLALHLWSRRPRQLMRVGTLRHLDGLPAARARSARLSDPLLLLLRLLIVAAIVTGLAGLRLRGPVVGLPARLVLVDPALAGDAALDSLGTAPVRLIAPGLPQARLAGLRPDSTTAMPLWEALQAADRLVAPDGAIEVYARPRMAALGPERPAVRATVRWHPPAALPPRRWLAALASVPGDSLQAIVGEGDAAGIRYSRLRAADRRGVPVAGGVPPAPLAPRTLALEPADAATARRAALAVRAVSEELGQAVRLAAGAADAALSLSPEVLAGDALADTLLARWPWRPDLPDPKDPREVSVAMALPRSAAPGAPEAPAPRTRELLLLAGLLLILERWQAGRPRGSAA